MNAPGPFRPCVCDNCRAGEPFTADQCRLCWLFHDPSPLGTSYRHSWERDRIRPGTHVATRRSCRHLTRRVRDADGRVKTRDCPTCQGRVTTLDVFECRHPTFGPETTLSDCLRCEGYSPRERATDLSAADAARRLSAATTPGIPAESPPVRSDVATGDPPRTSAALTKLTPVPEVVRLLTKVPIPALPEGWAGWENVRLAHITLLEEAIRDCPPYPRGRHRGRGIVTCVSAKPGWSSGKNLPHGYFPGAWVLVKELRRLGCQLPILFAHLGPLEWDPQLTSLMQPLGVEIMDLTEVARRDPMRILGGWEAKAFAIAHAPYEEVLFLDADNLPLRDPSFLFHDPHYLHSGAVFWPDLPPNDRNEWLPPVVWHNVGLEPRTSVDFESGQLLIDKRRCWRELRATRHINEHSDWYYHFVFGDKSTFHLAWAKCGTSWAMPEAPAGWYCRSILQHDFGGRVLFYHACQDKPSLHGYADLVHLPAPNAYSAHLAELRRHWSGRLWSTEQAAPADRVIAARLRGQTFEYQRVGLDRRSLHFLDDDRIGQGAARCEFSWSVVGGVLIVSNIDGGPTFLAREDSGGVWRGRWLEHEKCEVVLTPVLVERPLEAATTERRLEAATAAA